MDTMERMMAFIKDQRIKENVYPDICDEALEVAEKYGLTETQLNLYNFLCRGEFYLTDGDGDMFFNPESKGIGWSHDRDWVKRQLNKLIKAGLVKMDIQPAPRDRRYKIWFFYDARYNRKFLIDGANFVANWQYKEIQKMLSLPEGWFHTGSCDVNGLIGGDRGDGYLSFSYNGIQLPYGGLTFEDAIHQVYDYVNAILNPFPITDSQKEIVENEAKKALTNKYYTFFSSEIAHTEQYGSEQKRECAALDLYFHEKLRELKEK